MLHITRIGSGGVIPVYRCPAACRHCLYGCSNRMNGRYITREQATELAASLRSCGCRAVHIGGGEPFLNFDGLVMLIESLHSYGVKVEYIETNAAWCADSLSDDRILAMLSKLKGLGADCLLISADPFHVEFVPLKKPLRLINLCKRAGMGYFVWKQSYLDMMSHLDRDKTYTRVELEQELGKDYIIKTANHYGLSYNGRALSIAREFMPKQPIEQLLSDKPCSELLNTNHYHADFNGYYIPPGCTGIGVLLQDLKESLTEEKYPVFNLLANTGINGLYEYARQRGFTHDEDGYVNRCDLCFSLRKHLLSAAPSADIYPADYYDIF